MGKKPKGDYSLERINNNGNYEPSNCKWATRAEQRRNERRNNWIEFSGKRMVITDWAKEIGMNVTTLHRKLKKDTMDSIIKSINA